MISNRRFTLRLLFEAVSISTGTGNTILNEDLKLHKVCVPNFLSNHQVQFRLESYGNILEMIEPNPEYSSDKGVEYSPRTLKTSVRVHFASTRTPL